MLLFFAWSWACPRPERLPIPYYHVMNSNTQGGILHCVVYFHLNVKVDKDIHVTRVVTQSAGELSTIP